MARCKRPARQTSYTPLFDSSTSVDREHLNMTYSSLPLAAFDSEAVNQTQSGYPQFQSNLRYDEYGGSPPFSGLPVNQAPVEPQGMDDMDGRNTLYYFNNWSGPLPPHKMSTQEYDSLPQTRYQFSGVERSGQNDMDVLDAQYYDPYNAQQPVYQGPYQKQHPQQQLLSPCQQQNTQHLNPEPSVVMASAQHSDDVHISDQQHRAPNIKSEANSELVDIFTSDEEDPEDDIPLMQRMSPRKTASPIQCRVSQSMDSVLGRATPNSLTGDHDQAPQNNTVVGAEAGQSVAQSFSFKLPEFEAFLLPLDPQTDYPVAKVSLPGIVRHEIYLSPDHYIQEFHLIQHVFLPSEQKLHNPAIRPDPNDQKLSLLNFHTIACLVIGVHETMEHEDGIRPEDADTDEVFFAALDNWRVGRQADRSNYLAVRGIQEFVDVALDVIFYLKQHGFVDGGKKKVRAERSDKGVKRGPRQKKDGDKGGLGGGGSRMKGSGGMGRKSTSYGGMGGHKKKNSTVVNVLEAKSKSKMKVNAQGGGKVKHGRVEKVR